MNIIISSFVYRPEQTGFRPHDLAAGLTELGHDVIAVTGLPSYPHGHIYQGYHLRIWQWEEMDGVKVLRLPYVGNRSRASFVRISSYAYFSFLSSIASLLQQKKPTIIWTNQIGYPGLWLKMLRKINWVHEIQDLWPEWGQSANIGMKEWMFKILEKQQMNIYSSADRITVISKGFQSWLIEKGVQAEKIKIIPNWADQKQYKPLLRDKELGDCEKLQGYFNVIYTGNIGSAQALAVVLKAAEKLKDLKDLQFVFIGEGFEKNMLAEMAQEMGLRNIRFIGQRPTELISKYLAWADVLFLHLKDDPLYHINIPSKTYSYLASGRPILAAIAGDVSELIQECKAGISIPSENPDALATALRRLYSMPVNNREKMGENARQAVIKKFDRMKLVREYEKMFRSIILENS